MAASGQPRPAAEVSGIQEFVANPALWIMRGAATLTLPPVAGCPKARDPPEFR